MNRREFGRSMAATAVGAAVAPLAHGSGIGCGTLYENADGSAAQSQETTSTTPFPLSIMLWTVFRDLPFEERLAKVAEAGYTNVELVGEYKNWTDADFARANEARRRLGIHFDATAGLPHGIANPEVGEAFLADLKQGLGPMEKLDCPAMIVLSGNVVPGLSHDAQHEASIETLKRAAAIVEGKQIAGQPVRLLLECIDPEENPKYFLTSAAEAIEVVRAVNHPQVQFLYDMFHEQIAEGNLIEKLDKHIDMIGLIHIADVPGRHEPGTGEINYANIYRKLAQLDYRHIAAMEFRPSGEPIATLRAASEMVAHSVRA